jgi:hypothetical protein
VEKFIQTTLTRALLTLLEPLVRILLRNGIAYGSFAELVKKTYVDVAFEDYAPSGKKQTISRVSAMTGMTRKETKRLHDLQQPDAGSSAQRYNRAVRVISGWVNDAQFQNTDGTPAVLSLDGADRSFAALVRKYSGDMTTRAMLAVLETADSVAHTSEGIELVRHAYLPGKDPREKLSILGIDTAELITTINHNLVCADEQRRFQRKVSNHRIRADAVAAFRALSAEKSQALLEELDAWLSEHEIDADADAQDNSTGRYVSLGIYFYARDPGDDQEDLS